VASVAAAWFKSPACPAAITTSPAPSKPTVFSPSITAGPDTMRYVTGNPELATASRTDELPALGDTSSDCSGLSSSYTYTFGSGKLMLCAARAQVTVAVATADAWSSSQALTARSRILPVPDSASSWFPFTIRPGPESTL
jgi:hypothetical protein